MKTNLLLWVLLFNCLTSIYAQTDLGINEKENWLEYWTEFDPKKKEYREPKKILAGYISENITLTSRDTYLLQGTVYVINNATLSIEPGTVIRGDYDTCGTLVITKGAKIIAEGTESFPIIFTTNKESFIRKPGDWGGIVIMGDAPINSIGGVDVLNFGLEQKYNLYGGNNSESNSGILKYVRVEYAGRKLNNKKELNGISFAGVGNKTVLQNIQVSYSNDDSFEFYGGNVKLEKLISYRASDDDFDFTQGVQADFKNSIALRNPYSSDAEKSRCLEIDSYDLVEKFDIEKSKTNVNSSNLTLINLEDNNQGLVKEAVYLGNDSYITINNSVIFGFKDFLITKEFSIINEFNEYINLKNLVIAHCDNIYRVQKGNEIVSIDAAFNFEKKNISIIQGTINDFFRNSNVKDSPDFRYSRIETKNIDIVKN